MGEFEPQRSRDVPKQEIERSTEFGFTEITTEQTQPISLPSKITWDTAQLRFNLTKIAYSVPSGIFGKEERVLLYEGALDYVGQDGQIYALPLSPSDIGGKPTLFAGSNNGFYAHDPEITGRSKPFYVVGIQPGELQENMRKINALYHERFGHVTIFENDYDISIFQAGLYLNKKYLPPVASAIRYAQVVANAAEKVGLSRNIRIDNRYDIHQLTTQYSSIDQAVSLFHERNAWAGAGYRILQYGLPTGFENQTSFIDYAKLCLKTYAQEYNDNRFIQGLFK